jgi:hypothetical protein
MGGSAPAERCRAGHKPAAAGRPFRAAENPERCQVAAATPSLSGRHAATACGLASADNRARPAPVQRRPTSPRNGQGPTAVSDGGARIQRRGVLSTAPAWSPGRWTAASCPSGSRPSGRSFCLPCLPICRPICWLACWQPFQPPCRSPCCWFCWRSC